MARQLSVSGTATLKARWLSEEKGIPKPLPLAGPSSIVSASVSPILPLPCRHLAVSSNSKQTTETGSQH